MSVFPAEASTAQISGDFVVFIIGVAVHNWWDVRGWWPVVTGFSKMMQELKVLRCTSSVWRGHTVHVMADSVRQAAEPCNSSRVFVDNVVNDIAGASRKWLHGWASKLQQSASKCSVLAFH